MSADFCDHHYYNAPNTLPGTEGTYHGVYVSNGTDNLDDVADDMAGAGIKPATSKLVIRTLCSKAAELVSTLLCRVSAGPISFEPAMSGTLPYANSMPGPDNELYVNVRLSDAMRNIAAGITPKRTDPNEVTARIDGVRGVTSSEPKVIVSGESFRITGWCISATGPGEGVAVVDKDGASHAAEVISDEHGQRIIARVPETIPEGPATVVLTTHGYLTPDGELRTCSKNVTVFAAEPGPEPEPLVLTSIQTAGVQEGQVNETNTTSIRGQDNLYPWDSERDSVVVHFDGQELTVPDVEFSAGNETLQFQIPQRVGEVLNDDDTLSFTVTINGAVGTIDAVWKH